MKLLVNFRRYLYITSMFLVIIFLFMLPSIIKDQQNPYGVNEYANTVNIEEFVPWEPLEINELNENVIKKLNSSKRFAVCLGKENKKTAEVLKEWCTYTKTEFIVADDLMTLDGLNFLKATFVVVDSHSYDLESNAEELNKLAESGVTLVFADLPKAETLKTNKTLMNLLGISEVKETDVELKNIHLHKDLLIGSEEIYAAEPLNEAEKKMQDLKLNAPWYLLKTGSKSYMTADVDNTVLEDIKNRNEQLPSLIWRYNNKVSNIFAVNGDYLKDTLGLGLLTAFASENNPYYIYPVVNAQVFQITNYPGMADENKDNIAYLFGDSQRNVIRNLIWPNLETMIEKTGYKFSFYLMPEYDYKDESEPNSKDLVYYLKLIKEKKGEAGLSLIHNDSINLKEKQNKDLNFLNAYSNGYDYKTAAVSDKDLINLNLLDKNFTSVTALTDKMPVLKYLDDHKLFMRTTQDAFDYKYSNDLNLKGIETALGYSNAAIDMNRALWPLDNERNWQELYETAASTFTTYWNDYKGYEVVTASVAEKRIRNFLALDYTYCLNEDVIEINVENTDESYFVMKARNFEINEIEGCEITVLDNNFYLIKISDKSAKIHISKADTPYYLNNETVEIFDWSIFDKGE